MLSVPGVKLNGLLKLLSWSLLFLSILCSYSVFTLDTHSWLVSNDAVTIQFMYDDLIAGQGTLQQWKFPVAPSLFPDLLLYSLIQLFHFNFMVSIALYALAQMTIISLLGIYIFKKTVPAGMQTYSWLVPAFFSIIFLEAYYFSRDIALNHLITSCYYHAGAFVNGLIAYSVFLSRWPDRLKYLFLILFSSFSVFNDLLYVTIFCAPFILTLLFIVKRTTIKYYAFCAGSVAAGAAGGVLIYKYVKDNSIIRFLDAENVNVFTNIIPSMKEFGNLMWYFIQQPGFRSFHVVFAFMSLLFTAFLLLFKRKNLSGEIRFFLIFLLSFSVVVLSAPILAGNFTRGDNLRYNAAFFYFSVITLAFFVAYLFAFKIHSPVLRSSLSLLLLIGLLIPVLIRFSPSGLRAYVNYYPDNIRKLDSLSEKYGLKHGISQHGYSKVITLFSRKKLEVLAVYGDASIADLGSNISWYYDKDFDFAIVDENMLVDPSKILKIKDTLYAGNYTVLRVEKFYYPRGGSVPVNR